ncbi:hypothetical protein B046DRAFT_05433 [Streptomyces sp. LamerLS-316]|nr:DUF4118 domain-containing protein [Streptomyces sp. SID4921]SCK51034.1 hypothetical protein B046DRAFT_05433 [Streptomyces sp. LamerLS-316]
MRQVRQGYGRWPARPPRTPSTHAEVGKGRGLPVTRGARLGRTRVISGWLAGVLDPLLLVRLLSSVAPDVGLANGMLLFLFLTAAAALLDGLLPALASAVVGSLLLNWFFTPPVHSPLGIHYRQR